MMNAGQNPQQSTMQQPTMQKPMMQPPLLDQSWNPAARFAPPIEMSQKSLGSMASKGGGG